MLYKISFHTLYRDYVQKSACQFVYLRNVGVICRTRNNRYLFFSPPGREPAIQKVLKYGMRDPYMFKNTINLYIVKVWVLFVGDKTIKTLFSARQAASLRSKKCLSME
jgi:hypothetical protein